MEITCHGTILTRNDVTNQSLWENVWNVTKKKREIWTNLERRDSTVSSEDANISFLAHDCNYRDHVLFTVPKKPIKATQLVTLAIYEGCVGFKPQLCPRFTCVPNVAHHVHSICLSATCCWRSSGRWWCSYKPTRLPNRHLQTSKLGVLQESRTISVRPNLWACDWVKCQRKLLTADRSSSSSSSALRLKQLISCRVILVSKRFSTFLKKELVRQFCRLNQKKVSPLISSFARFFKMCIEISRLQHSWWQSGLLRSSATQENFLSFCLNTCRTSSRANYHISMPTHGAMMVNLLNTSTLMLASESC